MCRKGENTMRILLKILLFPVTLALTILVAVLRLLCQISGAILTIVAMVILAIAIGTVALLGKPLWTGVKIAGLAWLISPFGVPLVATFIVEALGGFNDLLKAV